MTCVCTCIHVFLHLNVIVCAFFFQTTAGFKSKYQEYVTDFIASDFYKGNSSTIASLYESLSYDAIWSLALALDKTDAAIRDNGFTLADFEYSQAPPDVEGVPSDGTVYDDTINNYISNNLSYFMSMTDFRGVSVSCYHMCVCL